MTETVDSLLWQKESEKLRQEHPKKALNPDTLLAPVPVTMISVHGSTPDGQGSTDNIFTVSWTGTINSDPPMLSISVRAERYSWPLIEESGEFVVNFVSRDLLVAADYCGVVSGRDRNKADDLGLHYVEAKGLEQAKAIKESPVTISCKVARVVPLGSHQLVLAHIVAVEVSEPLLDDKGHVDLAKANLVAYVGRDYYGLGRMVGFHGYSVARPHVRESRMQEHQSRERSDSRRDQGRGRGGFRGGRDRDDRGGAYRGGRDRDDRGGAYRGGRDRDDRGGAYRGGRDRDDRGAAYRGGRDRDWGHDDRHTDIPDSEQRQTKEAKTPIGEVRRIPQKKDHPTDEE